MNDPRDTPPGPGVEVRLSVRTSQTPIKAYRVDYRKRVCFPDYIDRDMRKPWRFCKRATGLDRVPQDIVLGWYYP